MPHWVPGKVRHRGGQQVRRAVAYSERFRALVGHDLDGRVPVERIRQIDQPAVHDARERGQSKARRDPFRDVANARAGRHGPTGSVRKRDGDFGHAEQFTAQSRQFTAVASLQLSTVNDQLSLFEGLLVGTGGLEPRPPACQAGALTSELRAYIM